MEKSLFTYFKECITTKKYFSWNGRASRKELWSFILFYFLIMFALLFIIPIFTFLASISLGGKTFSLYFVALVVAVLIPTLGFIIPSFSVLARRFHDINASGLWALFPIFSSILALIFNNSFVNIVMSLISLVSNVLALFKSSYQLENKYGLPAEE